MRGVLLGGAVSIAVFYGVFSAGRVFGHSEQKRATVVRIDTPYYRGPFFGTCGHVETSPGSFAEACPTDVAEDSQSLPPGESVHFDVQVAP